MPFLFRKRTAFVFSFSEKKIISLTDHWHGRCLIPLFLFFWFLVRNCRCGHMCCCLTCSLMLEGKPCPLCRGGDLVVKVIRNWTQRDSALCSLSLTYLNLNIHICQRPILTSKQTILSLFSSLLDLYFDFEQKNQLCMASSCCNWKKEFSRKNLPHRELSL